MMLLPEKWIRQKVIGATIRTLVVEIRINLNQKYTSLVTHFCALVEDVLNHNRQPKHGKSIELGISPRLWHTVNPMTLQENR